MMLHFHGMGQVTACPAGQLPVYTAPEVAPYCLPQAAPVSASPICGISTIFPEGSINPINGMMTLCPDPVTSTYCEVPPAMANSFQCPALTPASAPAVASSSTESLLEVPTAETTGPAVYDESAVPVYAGAYGYGTAATATSSSSSSSTWLWLGLAALAAFFILGGAQ